jgi:pimeloyl-ACP methyl ester carboxylesterase
MDVMQRRSLFQVSAAAAVAASRGRSAFACGTGLVTGVRHRRVMLGRLEIFYREAGPPDGPAVLLLHGFPSSSFMFRELMPVLAHSYRVVAPDYPGFGQSSFPKRESFRYTFAELASVVDAFTGAVGLSRYALYVQDYGAPIGFRVALLHPDRVTALVVQNGNAYAEGLSAAWDPLKAYWQAPTRKRRNELRGWLTEEGVRLQYIAGVPNELLERFSPDAWTLDWARLRRPGNLEMQLDLFADYRTNVALYPDFQRFFRTKQPPLLVAWGKYDPFFTLAGAQAFRRDLPEAEIELYETGHFALETHAREIGARMRDFLDRKLT